MSIIIIPATGTTKIVQMFAPMGNNTAGYYTAYGWVSAKVASVFNRLHAKLFYTEPSMAASYTATVHYIIATVFQIFSDGEKGGVSNKPRHFVWA